MKYYGDLGFGMFGWADTDIGIFGGQRSGGFQKRGQYRCSFSIYDTAVKVETGADKIVGKLELIVTEPENDSDPYEIMELVNLEIAREHREQGYGRRAVEAVMRAAPDAVRVCDIKKTKLKFWTKLGLEDLTTKGGKLSGHIRKEHAPQQARSMTMSM